MSIAQDAAQKWKWVKAVIEWFLAFLIAAIIVVVGAGIVWLLDTFLDTMPKIFMVLFVLLMADATLIYYIIWG